MQWRKESHLTSNWSDRYQKLKTLKFKWLKNWKLKIMHGLTGCDVLVWDSEALSDLPPDVQHLWSLLEDFHLRQS